MRAIKLVFAGWALAFAAALLLFLCLLWTAGPDVAERVWGALPVSVLFIIGLVVARRFLRL